jgi:preprotein translocase subunit YajC
MILDTLNAFLAFGPAPSPPGTAPNPNAQLLNMLGTFAIMGFIFYFLLIRPQQKKAKDHQALMKTIRSGDKITTTSGIMGIVVAVKEKSLSIRSADTKLEILKSAVSEINERADGNGSASA